MIKQLTKFEKLYTKTNVEYYKLYFGNQWFLVTPWHYSVAKLNDNFNLIASMSADCVGSEYDITWRTASINGSSVTFLTKIEKKEVEFTWISEEQGNEVQYVGANNSSASSVVDDYDPFSDENDFPF